MKKLLLLPLLAMGSVTFAQQFISEGQIEYEVRTNNYKIFGDGIWAEMARERFPQFSTSYFNYTFDNNKSVYKLDHYDEKNKIPFNRGEADEDTWYSDYTNKTFVNQKYVFDDNYILTGELMKIDWKLSPGESREIAGFNCRKATGVIFDSVYVFAFYTDEITISGGPMGLNGLPGMILGITIPRMYTSWVATKVQIVGVDTKKIIAPAKGKPRDAIALKEKVVKATSDWGNWGQQAVWKIFL